MGTSADIIAYLRGVDPGVCLLKDDIVRNGTVVSPKQLNAPFNPKKPGAYLSEGGTTTIKTEEGKLDGKLEGCFDNNVSAGASDLIYYHVLLAQ